MTVLEKGVHQTRKIRLMSREYFILAVKELSQEQRENIERDLAQLEQRLAEFSSDKTNRAQKS